MTTEIIKKRLKYFVNKNSDLKPLVDLIPDNLEITSEFVSSYLDSNLSYNQKASILRVLFGDSFLLNTEVEVDLDLIKRVVTFYKFYSQHKNLPFWKFTRDNLSQSLEQKLVSSRNSSSQVFDELMIEPYWRAVCGKKPYQKVPQINLDENLSFLKEFWEQRFLGEKEVSNLISNRSNTKYYDFYFNTSVQELNLRNIFFYSQTLINQTELTAGQTQSKIPASIKKQFEITRLSVPELNFLLDIGYLIYNGVITKSNLNLDSIRDKNLELLIEMSDFEDFDKIITRDEAHYLLTSQKIENSLNWHSNSSKFNFTFFRDGLFKEDYHNFAHYYENLDEEKLEELVQTHIKIHSPEIFGKYEQFKEEFKGIKKMEFANMLMFIDYMQKIYDKKPQDILPYAVREAFGYVKKNSITTQTKSKSENEKRKKGKEAVLNRKVSDSLPKKLEEILNSNPKAYLIDDVNSDSFKKLPNDAMMVYLPKSIARIYNDSLPQNYIPVGDETLEFRKETPQSNAKKHLENLGYDVEII